MKFLLAVTTYCRPQYLTRVLQGWSNTRSRKHDWLVVIADDGSSEEQIQKVYRQLSSVEFYLIRNVRRGIHHQVNSILRLSESLDFDFGFRVDDDICFKEEGWDEAYWEAAKCTGYWHLVHHDPSWKRVKRRDKCDYHPSGMLESRGHWDDLQGAFWTFTKAVVERVGYIDVTRFNLCGFGHRDYTYRCCKAGFNLELRRSDCSKFDSIWDLKDSGRYIELIKDGYESAPERDRLWLMWNNETMKANKFSHFGDSRIFVPYCENQVNIEGGPIQESVIERRVPIKLV